jgi:hypothetical protein
MTMSVCERTSLLPISALILVLAVNVGCRPETPQVKKMTSARTTAETVKVKSAKTSAEVVIDGFHGYPERYHEKYSILVQQLEKQGRHVSVETNGLSPATLTNCDLLVAIMPTKEYLPYEITSIRALLERGGSLLILGGNGGLDSLPIGISLISSKHAVYGPSWLPKITEMIDHPITRGIVDVTYDTGRALELRPPAVGLGSSGADTWLEPLGKGTRQPSPEKSKGPFTAFAVSEVKKGRVFYGGSHLLFLDNYVKSGARGNSHLMRQSIRWLLQPQEDRSAAQP